MKFYIDNIKSISINEIVRTAKAMETTPEGVLKQLVNGEIKLTTTSLTYGDRFWFVCPSCSKRSGKLYQYTNGLTCRKCLNLKYRDQSLHRNKYFETVIRPAKKLKRIENKLKANLKDKTKLQEQYKNLLSKVNVY